MKLFYFLLIIITFVGICACSLKKSNPLESHAFPGDVDWADTDPIVATATGGRRIVIRWKEAKNAVGYYVYRSMSYNGRYDRLDDGDIHSVNTGSNELYTYTDHAIQLNRLYYYKVSAYNDAGGEGHFSPWISVQLVE